MFGPEQLSGAASLRSLKLPWAARSSLGGSRGRLQELRLAGQKQQAFLSSKQRAFGYKRRGHNSFGAGWSPNPVFVTYTPLKIAPWQARIRQILCSAAAITVCTPIVFQ